MLVSLRLCQKQYLPNRSSENFVKNEYLMLVAFDQKNPHKIQIHNPKNKHIHWGNTFIRATRVTYRSQYQKATLLEINILRKQPKQKDSLKIHKPLRF